MSASAFAELCVATNFSFLRGASHPEELVAQAITLGLRGLGIADRNSLAGVVRAYLFLRENKEEAADLKIVSGARLVFCDGTPDILVYPRDRAAYGRLCRLLTRGNLRAAKGTCLLTRDDLLAHIEGQQIVVMPASTREGEDGARFVDKDYADFTELKADRAHVAGAALQDPDMMALLGQLHAAAPGRVWLAAVMGYGRSMRGDLARCVRLARTAGVPLLATNDALMHVPARRALSDVVTCIRLGVTLDAAGRRLSANAERHLKDGAEMARLFAEAPDAIAQTQCFLDGIGFSLDELKGPYPEELREGFATPQAALEHYAREGARLRYPADRYPHGVPEKVLAAIAYELKIVAELDYARTS